jgi:hypothetical protein
MKAYGSGGVAPCILHFYNRSRRVVSFARAVGVSHSRSGLYQQAKFCYSSDLEIVVEWLFV